MIGDGMADPIFIAGDRLNKFDVLLQITLNFIDFIKGN